MRVEDVLSLEEYDRRAPADWPHRIPNARSADLAERLGDCIYDYSHGDPISRPGVHGPENRDTDLSGKNVLISRDFYYFGAAGLFLFQTIYCPSATKPRGTRAKPMLLILNDL